MRQSRALVFAGAIIVACDSASAHDAPATALDTERVTYSPYPEQDFPNRVFFGDTHVHTKFSPDAGMIGCTLGPEASFTNSIGDAVLGAYWQDPEFDPRQRAFYYVRVLEIPTPRWTVYDAKFFGVELKPDDPGVIQERAYTSPIWYMP